MIAKLVDLFSFKYGSVCDLFAGTLATVLEFIKLYWSYRAMEMGKTGCHALKLRLQKFDSTRRSSSLKKAKADDLLERIGSLESGIKESIDKKRPKSYCA